MTQLNTSLGITKDVIFTINAEHFYEICYTLKRSLYKNRVHNKKK